MIMYKTIEPPTVIKRTKFHKGDRRKEPPKDTENAKMSAAMAMMSAANMDW